jgi:hexosaminidase
MQTKRLAAVAGLLLSSLLAATIRAAAAPDIAIIPRPLQVQFSQGRFKLTPQVSILVQSGRPAAADAAAILAQTLGGAAGLKPRIDPSDLDQPSDNAILLTTRGADASLGDEGYELQVTPHGVLIRSAGGAGLFYGVQTLLQLFPPAVYGKASAADADWSAPAVSIRDKPRFRWRGIMLDVARHFEPTEAVLHYLDVLAMHKINVFHWHLVDDQGWRIEIKKYPRLTQIGAWRDEAGFGIDPKLSTTFGPDGRYGGFYTQDDIRRVVSYAARLHITVVPEIEMPGHSTAALAAYPQFSTTGGPFTIGADAGIFHGVYCAGNDQTFAFLQDVLTEVMDLFPSQFIHVGGDEVPEDSWDDPADRKLIADQKLAGPQQVETYFINRISRFIDSHGRKLIGWDEILNPGLAADAAVMSWRGTSNGALAAAAGHDVVMSPTAFCYLDFQQGTNTEPRPWLGPVYPASRLYTFDPVAALTPEQAQHILGVQGNLWTERVPNISSAQYMTWPRAAAIAEIGWTDASLRDYSNFKSRMMVDEARLEAQGVNYRPIEEDDLRDVVRLLPSDPSRVEIQPEVHGAEIRYTLDGSYPTRQSALYDGPFALPPGDRVAIKAGFFRPGSVAVIVAAADFLDRRTVRYSTTMYQDSQWIAAHPRVLLRSQWLPGPGDTLTVELDPPAALGAVSVVTGLEGTGEGKIQHGVLEVSADGKTFTNATDFAPDRASIELGGKTIAAVRIRLTGAQSENLVIRDISLK